MSNPNVSQPTERSDDWNEAWVARLEAGAALALEYDSLQMVTPPAMYNLAAAILQEHIASIKTFPENYDSVRAPEFLARYKADLEKCAEGTMSPGIAFALWEEQNLVRIAEALPTVLPTDDEGLVQSTVPEVNDLVNSGLMNNAHRITAEYDGLTYCFDQYIPHDMLPPTKD